MSFSNISSLTTFGKQFDDDEKKEILDAMKEAYEGSFLARTMFENWIKQGPIKIFYEEDKFEANVDQDKVTKIITPTGQITIDLSYLDNLSYIDYQGKAKPYKLVQALARSRRVGIAHKYIIDRIPLILKCCLCGNRLPLARYANESISNFL